MGMVTREVARSAATSLDEGIYGVFAEQVGCNPAATALVAGDVRVTYGTLAAGASRVAAVLAGRGVGSGDLVAVTLPRGVEMVAALLGALKAGAGYVLVDPELPAGRRAAVLADTAPAAVVDSALMGAAGVDEAWLAVVRGLDGAAGSADPIGPAGVAGEPPATAGPAGPVWTDPAAVASVMFTSGSTGRPKGVVVPHRAMLATYLDQGYGRFDASQVWLQCSPVSWDAFALELFGALLHGGVCVLAPGQRPDPESVAELTVRHGVTQLQLSASLFNVLVDELPGTFAGLSVAFTGGEAASPAHIARIQAAFPDLEVVNGYGPVESLGFTTCRLVEPGDTAAPAVPIGVPIAAKGVYVLDERMRPVAPGVAGELYCTGEGLAHGYLGQGGLTASRFVPDPFGVPGSRMYRTGDIGHVDADGVLHVAGRADAQVKVRGFRVEPAEIVAALQAVPGIRQAAVTVVGEKPDVRLAAWVTCEEGAPEPRRVRELLADTLPDYMIPAVVTVLPRLPMTANGKLDQAALPEPDFGTRPATGATGSAPVPADSLMGRIGAVWSKVLAVGPVGAEDDYFALGGHSLNAVRTLYMLREQLSVDIPLRTLLDSRNLAEFTAAVEEIQRSGGPARKAVPLLGRRGTR